MLTDGLSNADITKLIVAFRNFANAPRKKRLPLRIFSKRHTCNNSDSVTWVPVTLVTVRLNL